MTHRTRKQITLDTETTGLHADKGDRIIEIGCVGLDGREISTLEEDHLQLYINPEREIPQESIDVHGITNEQVATCPTFAQIADEFIEFIRGAELLIHNAAFDVGFLNMELARCGKGCLEDYVSKITDTLEVAHKRLPGRRASLTNLCLVLEIDDSQRVYHGALLDAEILADVYLALTRGQGQMRLRSTAEDAEQFGKVPAPNRLKVIKASDEELIEHEKLLDKVEKSCKATARWRLSQEEL